VIDRGYVGKGYPSFTIELPADLSSELERILDLPGTESKPPWPPPLIWPALMTMHGTACLLPVWEDLGVNPLDIRLIREEYRYHATPKQGEKLTGTVSIEEFDEEVEPARGIEDQVDLVVTFSSTGGTLVATYRCSFRVPVAVMS
jgi:hypothetical protein